MKFERLTGDVSKAYATNLTSQNVTQYIDYVIVSITDK